MAPTRDAEQRSVVAVQLALELLAERRVAPALLRLAVVAREVISRTQRCQSRVWPGRGASGNPWMAQAQGVVLVRQHDSARSWRLGASSAWAFPGPQWVSVAP